MKDKMQFPKEELNEMLSLKMTEAYLSMRDAPGSSGTENFALMRPSVIVNMAGVIGRITGEAAQYIIGPEVFIPDYYGHAMVMHPNSPIIGEMVDTCDTLTGLERYVIVRFSGLDQNGNIKMFTMPVLKAKYKLLVENNLCTLEELFIMQTPKVMASAIKQLQTEPRGTNGE